eukprot:gene18229-24681_t
MRHRVQQFSLVFNLFSHGRAMMAYEDMCKEVLPFWHEQTVLPDLPYSHLTDSAGWDMLMGINEELVDKLKESVSASPVVSISLDEASARGKTQLLRLHVYYLVGFRRRVGFVSLEEIKEAPNAENLTQATLSALETYCGLDAAELRQKLVGVAADGASVMSGHRAGLMAMLKTRHAPRVVGQHCAPHRANLLGKALAKLMLCGKLECMVSHNYVYFAHSNKRGYALNELQVFVGLKELAMLNSCDTRWFSNLPAMNRLWNQYPALVFCDL